MYILGQIIGLCAAAVTIVRPMFRDRVHMLFCSVLNNSMSALNFILIGKTGSAVFLFLVAVAQSIIAIFHEKRNTAFALWEAVLFCLLYISLGFYGMMTAVSFQWTFSMHNLLEFLPIIGALFLMLSVFAKDAQRSRQYLLVNGIAWILYTAAVGSTTFFSCSASTVSTAIALWKYRRKGQKLPSRT